MKWVKYMKTNFILFYLPGGIKRHDISASSVFNGG